MKVCLKWGGEGRPLAGAGKAGKAGEPAVATPGWHARGQAGGLELREHYYFPLQIWNRAWSPARGSTVLRHGVTLQDGRNGARDSQTAHLCCQQAISWHRLTATVLTPEQRYSEENTYLLDKRGWLTRQGADTAPWRPALLVPVLCPFQNKHGTFVSVRG